MKDHIFTKRLTIKIVSFVVILLPFQTMSSVDYHSNCNLKQFSPVCLLFSLFLLNQVMIPYQRENLTNCHVCRYNNFLGILDLFGSKSFPGKSCKDILASKTSAVSGNYWIKLAPNKLFQVYCDMETHRGGWTLVYSYTFTNYSSFNSSSNTVTPRPS